MNDEEYYTWKDSLVYKPPVSTPQAQNATFGVKFSKDIFVSKSQCDKWNIPYKEEELEDSIIGKALRIKREKNDE